jgi:hypothetical protein
LNSNLEQGIQVSRPSSLRNLRFHVQPHVPSYVRLAPSHVPDATPDGLEFIRLAAIAAANRFFTGTFATGTLEQLLGHPSDCDDMITSYIIPLSMTIQDSREVDRLLPVFREPFSRAILEQP